MKPYYDSGDGIVIYHADCLEVLPALEAGSVDAVVTDPPYGVNFDRASWSDRREDYPVLMQTWIRAASFANTGSWFVWQALGNACHWHEWFPPDFRVLACCKGFVQYRPTPIQWSWDPVVFWGAIPGEPSVYRKDFFMQSIAPFGAYRERVDHPCPRPYETTEYVISLASAKGQCVLDPFMGSGTTGVACVKLGRKFIGIEIEEKYCEIAVNRILKAKAQGMLDFTGARP